MKKVMGQKGHQVSKPILVAPSSSVEVLEEGEADPPESPGAVFSQSGRSTTLPKLVPPAGFPSAGSAHCPSALSARQTDLDDSESLRLKSSSVVPIKRSIATKFDIPFNRNLPMVIRSSVAVATDALSETCRRSIEKLEAAEGLTERAAQKTIELQRLSDRGLDQSRETLAQMRESRREIEETKNIPRSFAGRVLLFLLYIVGLLIRILGWAKNWGLWIMGVPKFEETVVDPPPDDE
jgi:hypothetical protein